ncbi:acyltransferase family protein [Chitinophaga lutea]
MNIQQAPPLEAPIPRTAETARPPRLMSLDALRGFDMFWIMGAEELFHALAKATGLPLWETIATQMTHPAWNGFRFIDLIFPLFLFMSGVSTPYSVGRELEKGKSRQSQLWRIVRRGLMLVLLGIIYNNGLELRPLAEVRFGSVLGRIGLAYMFGAIIYLYASERVQMICFWGFIIGYWLLLKFTAAPGFPAGDLSMEGNFASFVDRTVMPGKLYLGIHDPEGLMSTLPAISTALLGIMTGNLLKHGQMPQIKKVGWMAGCGAAFIVLAQIWNLDFPINKNLWTSSFVLQVGGLSLLLMALFYYIIDVKGYQKWTLFFRVIGMNSILIYMSGVFINWEYTTEGFFKWLIQLSGEAYGPVMLFALMIGVKWVFLYFMYKKKVFLRV